MNSREKWEELEEDENYNPYKGIVNRLDYNRVLISGHFFDIHPELTGDWEVDRLRILGDESEERMNIVGQNGNDGLHYAQTTTGGVSFQFWEDQDFSNNPKDPNQTTLNI
jgi:hypothetical protein